MEHNDWAIVSGSSMLPVLKSGEIIHVISVRPQDVAIGDIIIYKKFSTHKTIHRVIDIRVLNKRRFYFITKGDNNEYIDEYIVYPHQIIGKVCTNQIKD